MGGLGQRGGGGNGDNCRTIKNNKKIKIKTLNLKNDWNTHIISFLGQGMTNLALKVKLLNFEFV